MRHTPLAAALLLPFPALAHPAGEHVHGLVAGLGHPLGGLDHLIAMVAVGLWAGLLGGRARWLLPAGFLAGMALGAVLGMGQVGLPMVEAGILVSVVVLGALSALALRLPVGLATAAAGVFGLLHGHAHGTEMAGDALAYGLGFLAATVALHAAGLALTAGPSRLVPRLAGAAGAVAGVALLLG